SDIASLIKLAAQDNDVTRIFVNPAIKQQLCLDAGSDRDWLRNVKLLAPGRPGKWNCHFCWCKKGDTVRPLSAPRSTRIRDGMSP
ncbi:penicillin-insensitive murein endopeptidase, partial [Salmonella enterica subsp. enterica serovar Montevideo]|nr:penicillin-insensitive murein endopeptidase [Salmonella enterica subsp. enterica serovar Montevideo]